MVTRIADTDYADVALYDKVNTMVQEVQNEVDNTYTKTEVDGLIASVEIDETNLVHKSDTETITGSKTFTQAIISKSTSFDSLTTPTSQQFQFSTSFKDKNDTIYGHLASSHTNAGDLSTFIQTSRTISGTTYYSAISAIISNTGVRYATCNTPALSSNSNEIVTAAWVNNKFQVVSSLPSSRDSNTFYFIPEES